MRIFYDRSFTFFTSIAGPAFIAFDTFQLNSICLVQYSTQNFKSYGMQKKRKWKTDLPREAAAGVVLSTEDHGVLWISRKGQKHWTYPNQTEAEAGIINIASPTLTPLASAKQPLSHCKWMVLHLNEQANNECWWWWICFACCAVLSQFSLLFNLSPLENLTFRCFFRLYIFTFCKLETVIYQIRGLLISGYWKLPKNNLVPFFGEAKNRHIQFPHAKHRFYFRFHIRGLCMKLCILSVSESNVKYYCVSKR